SIVIQSNYALVWIGIVGDVKPMAFRLAGAAKGGVSLWQQVHRQLNRFNAIQIYIGETTRFSTQLHADIGAVEVAVRIKAALLPTFMLWSFFSQWDRNNFPTTGSIACCDVWRCAYTDK